MTPLTTAAAPIAETPIVVTALSHSASAPADSLTAGQRATLEEYLRDTYASLVAMTDLGTGLTSDNIGGDLDPATIGTYTSPTNIGGYLWSTVVARDAGLVTADDAHQRMSTTLATLAGLDRHDASGMFYNWYNPATGDVVLVWPDDGNTVNPFLSSVDNGWLAAALRVVASAEPRLATQATALYDSMNFGVYSDPNRSGLLRGGFWDAEPVNQGGWVLGDYLGTGNPVYYTGHHYDTTVSETRIATYLGIANGQVPPTAYYATWRTFPDSCDWSWQEQQPVGVTRTYSGVDVYEGAYRYRGMGIVPGWGGSMFEALMPDMLVPEAQWGPASWGVNHPLMVKAQKQHGLEDAGYGYWGFSPASNPFGGYAEYGVDVLGLRDDGYLSDGVTNVDVGFGDCRAAANPEPEFGDGVVTPHASFLGLEYDAEGVLENLANIRADFDSYGPGGFYDAIAVRSGTVAHRYLSLDQSMIVAAIGNFLHDGVLREHFVDDTLEQAVRPLLEAEAFSSWDSVSVTTPAWGVTVNADLSLSTADGLSATAEPGITGRGAVNERITLSDGERTVATVDADETGAWLVPSSQFAFADGATLTLTASQTVHGESSTAQLTVTVDASADAPVITMPADAAEIGQFPTISGGHAEPNAVVTVRDGSNIIGTTIANAAGEWSLEVTTRLSVGGHVLTATQTDILGNASVPSAAHTVTVAEIAGPSTSPEPSASPEPSDRPSTAPSAPPAVKGGDANPSEAGSLPKTGTNNLLAVVGAVVMLLLGSGLVLAARNRRTNAASAGAAVHR